MKTVKLSMLLLLMVAIFSAKAGDPKLKITWGQEYELPKKYRDEGFLGNLKSGFTQIGFLPKKSLSLQKFSPSLKLESTKMIDLTPMPKDLTIERYLSLGGKTYFVYSTWEKSDKKERLHFQEVNEKKGSFEGKPIQIVETDKIAGSMMVTGFYQFAMGDKYKIQVSTDSSKLGVIVKYPNESKDDSKNKLKFGFWMYDNQLKALWQKEVTMPYTEKKMDINDKTIDRDGNILFLARVFDDESEKKVKDGKVNFHFEILKFTKDSKNAISIPFKFDENYVSQLELFEDFQGKIVCAGFYASKNRKGKIVADGTAVDGSFFLRLNSDDNKLSNIHKGFYEIPTEVLKQYETEKTQKKVDKAEEKGGVAAANLRLRSVYFEENGSITLFGEQYYYVVTTYTNGRTTTTRTTYYYLDIIAQHIGANGELSWTKKVPKSQVQTNSTYGLGFRVLATADGGYNVFFMDNLKNLNLNTDQAPATHSTGIKGILVCVNISDKGDMKKTKVFDTREMKDKINIIDADKVSGNSFINRTWIKKVSKICLMTIE